MPNQTTPQAGSNTVQATDGTPLNALAVNLAKAIREQESSGDYNAVGDLTKGVSKGAYQFNKDNFKNWATQYKLDPNDFSPVNQDKVAYAVINDDLQKGLSPSEIAAKWNGAKLVNGKYVANNPAYVEAVKNHYAKIVGQTPTPPQGGTVMGASTTSDLTAADRKSAEATGASFPVTTKELNTGNPIPTTLKAIGNVPSSLLNLGKGLLTAASHPIKTAEGLGAAIAGGASELGRALGTGANVGKDKTEAEKTFDAITGALKDRYGSVENAARTATNDPAGVGADILSVLYGGTAAIDKVAGTTAADLAATSARQGVENFSQTGLNVMPKQGSGLATGLLNKGLTAMAQPVATGVKAVAAAPFKGVAQMMGLQTGVGADPIKAGFTAAMQGGDANKAFLEGLRGNSTPDQLVSQARDALGEVVSQRGDEYKKMLASLGKDKTTYDISPVYQEVDNQLGKFGITKAKDGGLDFSRSKFALDTSAQKDIENLYNYVKSYGSKAGDRTALGVDNLKQVLGGYFSPNSDYRAFVQAIKGSTRKVLNDAPGYTKAMSDYSDMTDTIKDIKQSLSLGDTAAVETSFKKLISSLKNNDFRKQVVQQLDEATGGQLLPRIAGTQLSSAIPRGLAGVFEGGLTSATAIFAPQALLPMLGLAITTSPRVVGEFIHALGVGARGTNALMNLLNKFAAPAALGGNATNRISPNAPSPSSLQPGMLPPTQPVQ